MARAARMLLLLLPLGREARRCASDFASTDWATCEQLEIGAADGPGGLLFQGRIERVVAEEGPGAEGQHAGAEAPDELLLGRPVDLHGQDPLVAAGQPGEERLLEHVVVVEQAEVGVVADHDQVAAVVGGLAAGPARPARLRTW